MPTGCPRDAHGDIWGMMVMSHLRWVLCHHGFSLREWRFFHVRILNGVCFSHVWQRRVSFSNFSITHCWTADLYLVTILGRRRWAWSSHNFFVLCWFCQKPPLTWRRGGGWDWRLTVQYWECAVDRWFHRSSWFSGRFSPTFTHVTLPSFELMLDIEQMDKTCTREMDSPIVGWFDRHFLSVKAIFFFAKNSHSGG